MPPSFDGLGIVEGMESTIEIPQITTSTEGASVAAYSNVRGAALAMRELAEHGIEMGSVHVRPAGVTPVGGSLDRVAARPRRGRAVLVGVLASVAVVAVAGLSVGSVLLATIAAVLAAWFTLGIDDIRRAWARWRTRRTGNIVRAERFEIVCTDCADRVAHVLARWWDPEARPASSRTVT